MYLKSLRLKGTWALIYKTLRKTLPKTLCTPKTHVHTHKNIQIYKTVIKIYKNRYKYQRVFNLLLVQERARTQYSSQDRPIIVLKVNEKKTMNIPSTYGAFADL